MDRLAGTFRNEAGRSLVEERGTEYAIMVITEHSTSQRAIF